MESFGPRLAQLWQEIRTWYDTNDVAFSYRLVKLTSTMLRKNKAWPKLKCKAAVARCLIPFARMKASALGVPGASDEQMAIAQCCEHLALCYDCLSSAEDWMPEKLKDNSRKFAICMVALEARSYLHEHPLKNLKHA